MAFADYFSKNQQAAALLIKGVNTDLFRQVLENETIGIAFDEAAIEVKEGRAALDLTVRIFSRLYPNIALIALDKKAARSMQSYADLALSINPKITISSDAKAVTSAVVVGNAAYPTEKRKKMPVFYIGSNGWVAHYSMDGPVGCGDSGNPFGAGMAACLGAANLFKSVFSEQLPGLVPDRALSFSVLYCQPQNDDLENPDINGIDLGEIHLAGAGAIGNGFLWALSWSAVKGELNVVDGESLDLSNLQRYILSEMANLGQKKTDLAQFWNRNKNLVIHAFPENWEQYVGRNNKWILERVAVAVDSADARLQVQGCLPKKIFNSWTQAGELGISRHEFLGDMACLACLYIPRAPRPNYDQIVLESLKLPAEMIMDVRQRLATNVPTEQAFLEIISANSGVPMQNLISYEGKPLRTLYIEAICGGAILEFGENANKTATDVPMAFQSALAGILLAADVVADAAGLRPALPTITQISLLQKFPAMPSHPRRKNSSQPCVCHDEDFIARYQEKYH